MKLILNSYFFAILFFAVISIKETHSQNITSPYSILGIGDVDTKDFGRYFGSGNASLARRDANSYNFSNPASLTSLPFKTMNFDISTRGRNSIYTTAESDTTTGISSKDFVVKRITMAFKVGKKTGIAFGLKPYSSVNYNYLENNVILDGNSFYNKSVEGSGGISQFYFSYAKEINKRFSIGASGSWLFGSLERSTQYISSAISLDITKEEKDFYTGAQIQGGIQYYSLQGKKWRHQLGLTSSVSTNLKGELTTIYNDENGSIREDIETGRKFKLPVSVGLAYSAVKFQKLTLSAEGNYYHWKYQKVNYANSYTQPSFRLSGGFEYAFLKNQGSFIYENAYISSGVSFEKSYLLINKNNLWDYSFSVGFGKNVSRFISFYSGLELGNKGRNDYGQVKEQYTQFVLGVTLKDIWIGSNYSKRYN